MVALREKALMLTELAAALGYKGISKKLSTTVENMIATGKLKRSTDNKQIKISIT